MYPGLNVGWPFKQVVAMHSTINDAPKFPAEFSEFRHASLEGQVVDVADMIAYSTHDLDDALHIGLADEHRLAARGIELWIEALQHADHVLARRDTAETQVELTLEEVRGEIPRDPLPLDSWKRRDVRIREAIRWMIGRLVEDVIMTSDAQIQGNRVTSADMAPRHPHRLVVMSKLLTHQLQHLATNLREEVYYHPEKLVMEQKARRIIRGLFDAFGDEPRF